MTLQPLTYEAIAPEIDYPDSDGNPMADNTEQYRWIVIIKENLDKIEAIIKTKTAHMNIINHNIITKQQILKEGKN